ncbi:hypothetical protein L2K70_04985 [Nocardioides KLBMP 9356]|uniref:Uncharacterized protein n=1 Tax=Nocardioides potassii TaxID=2911371 RepID=A0ABS9H6U6_9ACTN|nr:hypothetical protein [Nocardioides potassii]MCF6376950.1 hypothetical protein [Nocardioides potassii]
MSIDTDEHYVREVIDSAMSGTRPPSDLPSIALARGRRLRTRRRASYAAAGIAAIALAGLAGPWIAAGGDRPVRDGDLIATQPPAPVHPAPKGWWDMPATDMVAAVEAIAPDGVTVTDPGPLEADTPEGGLAHGSISPMLVTTGGPGRLNVILSPGPAEDMGQIGMDRRIGCGGESSSDRTRCEELLDAAGNVVGHRLSARWFDGVVINEVVLRRDGGTVYAAGANSLDDKWSEDSPVSAARPPLSLDDLENLVRNDVWVSYEP